MFCYLQLQITKYIHTCTHITIKKEKKEEKKCSSVKKGRASEELGRSGARHDGRETPTPMIIVVNAVLARRNILDSRRAV